MHLHSSQVAITFTTPPNRPDLPLQSRHAVAHPGCLQGGTARVSAPSRHVRCGGHASAGWRKQFLRKRRRHQCAPLLPCTTQQKEGSGLHPSRQCRGCRCTCRPRYSATHNHIPPGCTRSHHTPHLHTNPKRGAARTPPPASCWPCCACSCTLAPEEGPPPLSLPPPQAYR